MFGSSSSSTRMGNVTETDLKIGSLFSSLQIFLMFVWLTGVGDLGRLSE